MTNSTPRLNIHALVNKYMTANNWRSTVEIFVTVFLLTLAIAASYFLYQYTPWLSLILIIPISLLFTRIFILQHDLGHGNLFKNKKYNDIVGSVLGILVWTPYHLWRKAHLIHHANGGNTDKRPWIGDIDLITVEEYQAKSPRGKFFYRLYRNPISMFIVGSIYVFMIEQRFYKRSYREHKAFGKKEFWSVIGTNIAMVLFYGSIIALLGIKFFLFGFFFPLWIAGAIGIYLFYAQHNFKERYFVTGKDWDFQDAALKGSSFYDLHQPLMWLTGNIGYHHVHTLIPRIPFYRLKACHVENNFLPMVKRYTTKDMPKLISLKLYDEKNQQMISWKEYKLLYLN